MKSMFGTNLAFALSGLILRRFTNIRLRPMLVLTSLWGFNMNQKAAPKGRKQLSITLTRKI